MIANHEIRIGAPRVEEKLLKDTDDIGRRRSLSHPSRRAEVPERAEPPHRVRPASPGAPAGVRPRAAELADKGDQ